MLLRLQVRRAQLAVAADMDSKEAEARNKLATMTRDLKGREYSYDSSGR